MSRCRESSGASLGSQITPPAESMRVERLGEPGEVAEVVHRRVAAHVAVADEGRAVDAAEGHRVAADVHGVGRVAGLDVELARRLGDLLEQEVGVEEDVVVLDPLAGRAEQVERPVGQELDADLGDQPPPALVQDRRARPRRGSRSAASGSGTSPLLSVARRSREAMP